MTDEQTIAWVTSAAEQNYAAGRPLAPLPRLGQHDTAVADFGDYLEEAARVMIPAGQARVARDEGGVRLVLG